MNKQEAFIWKSFGEQIHQDFVTVHGDFATGVLLLLASMKQEDRNALARILNEVLSSGASHDSMFLTWSQSRASYSPRKDQIEGFLCQLLKLTESVGVE